MKDLIGDYEEFPFKRNLQMDVVKLSSYRYYMEAYADIDVTKPREIIRKYKKKTGKTISFSAFIAYCIGRAVSKHKEVHALRKGKKVIMFDDVDIMIPVERIVDGKHFPTQLILRKANEKSLKELHDEVRGRQKDKEEKYSTQVSRRRLDLLYKLPSPIRNLVFWRRVRKNPFFLKKIAGTVNLVSIGMFGKGTGGWGVNLGFLPVVIVIGGISKKARIIEGKVVNREFLNLTIKVDHEMVDGAPATRFGMTIIDLIVNGSGLEEFSES
jgi:pyruvate/2-oxoglutarate dehydrogenase complex dihydrolipoamide acyltransferase (E2) component